MRLKIPAVRAKRVREFQQTSLVKPVLSAGFVFWLLFVEQQKVTGSQSIEIKDLKI